VAVGRFASAVTLVDVTLVTVARRAEAVVDACLVTVGGVAGSGEGSGAGSGVGVGATTVDSGVDAAELVGVLVATVVLPGGGSSLLEASPAPAPPAANTKAIPSAAGRTNRFGLKPLPRRSSGDLSDKS
jgi:hypothetical protein